MTLFQALLLGVLQGITEFLPVSSSGHLVLGEARLGLQLDTLKGFDVVLHAGTLLAMVVYFWNDIWALFKRWNLIGYIILATIPAVIVGLTLENTLDNLFRDPPRVLLMMMGMGLLFLVAEKFPPQKNKTRFTLLNTFVIGLAQAVALIPGVSRSGSTIATGLVFGLKREEAAKFSFLLGMPAIFGATLLTGLHVYNGEASMPGTAALVVGFLTSAIVGYASVAFLMKFLKHHKLNVFAYYLLIVGALGLILH